MTTPAGVRELARKIDSASNLHLGGLMVYPSNPESNAFMGESKMLLAQDGLDVERVSGGSSFCMWQAHEFTEFTEYRAGMYVYGDRNLFDAGVMTLDNCSYFVLATVVSRPTEDRVVLDSGSKSLAADSARQAPGHGLIVEYPEAEIFKLSEEHGHVDVSRCARKPEIGDRVTVLVNHCCVSNNLFPAHCRPQKRGGRIGVARPRKKVGENGLINAFASERKPTFGSGSTIAGCMDQKKLPSRPGKTTMPR